ncbi:MAG TPA: hypothetical protein VFZ34_02515 [Blastocatellia bacterium]|nr:hypothetical protein [Blastocatellia bacterium]
MKKHIVIVTAVLAATVRVAAGWKSLLNPQEAWCPDAAGYHELAAALLQGRFPSLFRTPGYPLYLALTGATDSNHIVIALLGQVLLDTLTAVLLTAIAWQLWQSEPVALLTGVFYALCPVMAGVCQFIVTESVAIFLVIAAIYLMLHWRTAWSWIAQALLWYAATMVRPSYALLPVVASVFFLWQARFAVTWKRQVCVLGLYALLTGAWIGFNYARAGVAVLSSNPDVSFYIYDTAAVRMAQRVSMPGYIRMALLNPPEFDRQLELYQLSYACEEQTTVRSSARDLWFSKDDPALVRALRAEAVQRLQGQLPLLAGIHVTGVVQSLRPKWNSAGWFFRLLDGARMLLLPMAVLVLLWQRQWWFLTFFAVWSAYALLPPGPVGAWRFRALIEPFISLTLALALLQSAQWLKQHVIDLMLNLEWNLGERSHTKAMSR